MRGIRCKTQSGIEAVFRAEEFVFCLGAIESSRFFLQPSWPVCHGTSPGCLANTFTITSTATWRPSSLYRRRFHQVFDNVFSRGFKYHPKLRLSPAVQAAAGTSTSPPRSPSPAMSDALEQDEAGREEPAARPLCRVELQTTSAVAFATCRCLPGRSGDTGFEHRIYNPPDGKIMLRVHCEQEPLSKSTISLADSRDSLGLLRTRLDWQISEKELDTVRNVRLCCTEIARIGGASDSGCGLMTRRRFLSLQSATTAITTWAACG